MILFDAASAAFAGRRTVAAGVVALRTARGGGAEEVQADCICIVYLCVPVSVCVIEGGGGASSTLALESALLSTLEA